MTGIIARVLLGRFAWAYVVTLTGILTLVLTIDAATRFHHFFPSSPGAAPPGVWAYYRDFLPFFFLQCSPAVTLIAAVFVLAPLKRRAELAAMAAAGHSRAVFLFPLFVVAILATILVGVVQERVLTGRAGAMTAHRARHRLAKRHDTSGLVIGGDVTVLYRSITEAGTFADVVMARLDNAGHIREMAIADNAALVEDTWSLAGVRLFTYTEGGMRSPAARRLAALDVPSTGPVRGVSTVRGYSFPTLAELRAAIRREPDSPKVRTAFWSRIVFPFLHGVVLVLGVGIFLAGDGVGPVARRVVYAFLGAVVFFFLHVFLVTLSSNGFIPAVLGAGFAPVTGAAWGWWLISTSRCP